MINEISTSFRAFNAASVSAVVALANADVAAEQALQTDTYTVNVSPIIVLPEGGGFSAVVTLTTIQINVPLSS